MFWVSWPRCRKHSISLRLYQIIQYYIFIKMRTNKKFSSDWLNVLIKIRGTGYIFFKFSTNAVVSPFLLCQTCCHSLRKKAICKEHTNSLMEVMEDRLRYWTYTTKTSFQTGEEKESFLRLLLGAFIDTKVHEKTPITFHSLLIQLLENCCKTLTPTVRILAEETWAISPNAKHIRRSVVKLTDK